jgi:hypothetical protein
MSKLFSHLLTLTLFFLFMVLSGCKVSPQSNSQIVSTPSLSLLVSKTPSPMLETVVQDTATINPETQSTVQLCNKLPAPQLSKPNEVSDSVYLFGKFYLCWYTESSFDMDSGVFGHTDAFHQIDTTLTDVELKATISNFDNSINYFILGANGAYITQSELESPTIEYCQEKTANPTLGGGIILGKVGVIGCVLTNEGRWGYIRIESIDQIGTESLEISFVTWNEK